jgi:hypothetical protein
MTVHYLAIALSCFLLLYHQLTTWLPLFPWNDVEKYSRKELLLEAGVNGALMGIGFLCLYGGNSGFNHWYPLIYYPFLFVGECMDWWIPYFSPSFANVRKIWDYEAHFSRTLKILPHGPGKRTPDANHTVLHLITLITVVVVYLERLRWG